MKKITCEIIKDILPLYVDDVVSADTRTMVEEHLAECESCKKEAEAMRTTAFAWIAAASASPRARIPAASCSA